MVSPSAPPEPARSLRGNDRPTRAVVASLLLLTVVAFWARCSGFRSVFPPSGEVELVPTDSHFYVRFARLQLHAFPNLTSADPYINHPEGAWIYLPLPHALLVALFVAPAEPQGERGAAWVGPVVGTLEWLLVAWVAVAVLGRGRGLLAAALLALTPAVIETAALGTADHHVHEPMFAAGLLLGVIGLGEGRGSARTDWLLGIALGLARWLTPSGFLLTPWVAAALIGGAWASSSPKGRVRARAAAARIGLAAAAVLTAGAVLFGRPLSLDYEQLSAFHPLLAVASLGGAVCVCSLLLRDRRPAMWSGAVAAAAALALLAELLRGGAHIARADPILLYVYESLPLWSDPQWALELFGPLLLLFIPAALGMSRALRTRAKEAAAAGAALAFSLPFLAAAAFQARFSPLAAAALCCACAVGLPAWAQGVLRSRPSRALAVALAAGGVIVTAPLLLGLLPRPFEPVARDLLLTRPTLRWMAKNLPPASSHPYSQEAAEWGVVSSHLLGHVIPLWAERPTVATMLSLDPTFVAANRRAVRVLASEDEASSFAAARETGARYVLATPLDRFLGGGEPSERSLLRHLLDHAGMAHPAREASAHFRLIYDSEEQRLRPEGGSAARLFEVVPGAMLRGQTSPGAAVTATLSVVTNRAERLSYQRTAVADAAGAFEVRVAYPGTYSVRLGEASLSVEVGEGEVRSGRAVVVAP